LKAVGFSLVTKSKIDDQKSTFELVDTHCHIHDSEFEVKYEKSQDELISEAHTEGISKLICVGTDYNSSAEAVEFVKFRTGCFASLGIHPHEVAKNKINDLLAQVERFKPLLDENRDNTIAIGECGFDYYYHTTEEARNQQKMLFRSQIELALQYQLPIIFHIRNGNPQSGATVKTFSNSAFEDFFQILDEYEGIRGVVHSFSAGVDELKGCLDRGLYIGLNGIMTFSKQTDQLEAAKMVPLDRLVLETDAPFLTPAPFRGRMCEPKHVFVTASFLSEIRGESLKDLAKSTTANAQKLFGI
jgi:TatD DNase family protein